MTKSRSPDLRFGEKAPGNMSSMSISGFSSSFNAEQREQAKLALQSAVRTGQYITFTETSNTAAANIKFGLFDYSSRGSYALRRYNPDSSPSVAGQTRYNAKNREFRQQPDP